MPGPGPPAPEPFVQQLEGLLFCQLKSSGLQSKEGKSQPSS